MLTIPFSVRIFLSTSPTDMRKGVDGLGALVTQNLGEEAYGAFSVIWIGLFINLIMATALVWVVFGIAKLTGSDLNMRWVVYGALALSIAVTGYAIWRARKPRIKRISVPLKNLPSQWKGKKVVHLSDIHLGVVRGKGYAKDMVRRVNALKPDLVLITGDLFDGMGGNFQALLEPLKQLKATHGVFFATGNHEGYLGLKRPLAAIEKTHIRILKNEVVEIDGLQIVGISFPEHDGEDDALAIKGTIHPSKPSILLYHTPTDVLDSPTDRGAQQNRTYFSPDTTFDFAQKHGIDLQLSGHTHAGQFFPFTLLTPLIYNGYDYGLHKIGDFHLYTTSGTGTWGPPMRLGSDSEIVVITLK